MKIQIIDGSTRFSGGRRMLFQHANELVRRGHDVTLWVERDPQVAWMPVDFPIRTLPGSNLRFLPAADIVLYQRWRFAAAVLRARRGVPVHLCQGFEGTDAENRLRKALTRQPWRHLPRLFKLWRRRRRLDAAYGAPSVKIVVHQPLRELLASRYGQWSYLVPYGLADDVFFPGEEPEGERPPVVLVVGPASIAWKRIGDALAAMRLLKQRRPDAQLVRIAPEPMTALEEQAGVTDEYHTMLQPRQMAEQYRRAAVLVVASDATEGFGLPALEAMACGTPTILTDIPSFRAFAKPTDYARFVPVGQPEVIAAALERMLAEGSLGQRLSARGLQVAADYTQERSYAAMSATLAEVLNRKAPHYLPLCKRQSA